MNKINPNYKTINNQRDCGFDRPYAGITPEQKG